MFKKVIIFVSLLVISPISTVSSFADAVPLQVIVNDKDYSASQFIIKVNHVYASIETVSSMMGALNGWVFKDSKSVSFITHFSNEGKSDELYTWYKNSNKVEIGSKEAEEEITQNLTMRTSTIISKEDEILLPLRESIRPLGKTIHWDSRTNKITISGKITY